MTHKPGWERRLRQLVREAKVPHRVVRVADVERVLDELDATRESLVLVNDHGIKAW